MLFSSFIFILIFFPFTFLLYYINKNRKYRNYVLLIASLVFYAWGEPKYILLLFISIAINYVLAILTNKFNGKLIGKILFIISILFNIIYLFLFKYLNFSINVLNDISNFNIDTYNIVMPIGISFYTFQMLSYVIDVYKKKVKLEKNIINFSLYITFFPQLIAGPIVKYIDISEQIKNRKESIDKIYYGLKRFMIGFFKKVVLANNFAIIVDGIYKYDVLYLSMPILWLAAISFTLQIYFDFSGYSDMAIGLAKIFGFDILENFNYPYMATSINNFWKRWNISLTNWFREYVYIPLGGNRLGKRRLFYNIILVFLLTGIWHGANYNFILWGIYNAFFMILEKIFLKRILDKIPKFIRYIVTILIVIVGFVIFRIENMTSLKIIINTMFSLENLNFSYIYLNKYPLIIASMYIPLGIICCFPIYKLIKIKNKYVCEIMSFSIIFIGYLYSILLLLQETTKIFIYFKF